MIDPDFEQKKADAEEYAPKRLARKDVADIRQLYLDAMLAYPSASWKTTVKIWLTRDRRRRGVARLGTPSPCVSIEARWTKSHEIGLDVTVFAHRGLGSPRDWKMRVGRHRFRSKTAVTQFAREVAHLTRLGLGWINSENARLTNIL